MSITKKIRRKPPKYAPGKDVARALRSSKQCAYIGQVDLSNDTQPALLMDFPAYAWIDEIQIVTSSDMPGGNSIRIGIDTDCDLFMASSDATRVGSHSSKYETQPGAGGYMCSAAQTLEMSWTTGITTGTVDVFITFVDDYRESAVENGS
jgi:hypothetical protein